MDTADSWNSWINKNWTFGKSNQAPGAFGNEINHGGRKIKKAALKHRADHSNPGGVVSEYFRQKRAKI